ncbi:MAG: YceD family protein [Acidithiobacillus sp.]|jgi:uncharacterized protein|nr:YceD family protein [Acidithiobacillus sp.]
MFSAKASSLPLARVSVHGDRLEGVIDPRLWSRLGEALVSVQAVSVYLDLIRRGQVIAADGRIEVLGEIRCERCMGAMPLQLSVTVHSGLAERESAVTALDPELEVVLAENGVVAQQSWLEDEVLLALPMIPRCAEWKSGVCPVSGLEPLTVGK